MQNSTDYKNYKLEQDVHGAIDFCSMLRFFCDKLLSEKKKKKSLHTRDNVIKV